MLRISGPDANTYLQGQFTQDVRIPPGNFCYGLWLNQKGKLLADSYILRQTPDEHLVFAPRSAPAVVRDRLEAYLIADEVEIADLSTAWGAIICWGTNAGGVVQGAAGGHSAADLAEGRFASRDGALIWAAPEIAPNAWLVLCAPAARAQWAARLQEAGAAEASWAEAERARINAGLPAVPDDLGEADLPNEGGLERAAISYTKGCYLGQEVMSRLKNLGQVRRRLLRVRGPGEPPARGAEVYQAGQRVGEFRSSARDGGGFIAFAMLSLVTLKPDQPLARSPGGAAELAIDHG